MQDILFKIEKNVWEGIPNENRIGLLNGLSGVALFYNYLYEVYRDDDFQNKLLIVVEKINTLLEEVASISSLCSGVAGYGLVLLKLKNTNIEIDEDYFENIDNLLLEDFEEMCINNNYDFLHGGMGIAMYFIERYKSNNGKALALILNNFSNDLINKIDTNFKDVLIENTFDRGNFYSFGLAHGVPSYLNFLIYLKKNFKGLKENIDKSIKICIDFLQAYKKFDSRTKQHYPNVFLIENNIEIGSRLSWCQGDLGVSNSLYNAGVYLNDEALISEAVELMNNTRIISFDESGVNDFGICHGSVGILVQYYLAGYKFNLDFSEDMDKWMKKVVQQTSNFNDFMAYDNQEDKYNNEINILEGAAGLGLVMLTKEKKIDIQWLEILNLH
jgi:lantibiotic biosynthesis protein